MESSLSCPLAPVAPVQPPAAYIGGKRRLARRLVERIAAVPHTTYAEPFVGMGGVFFRRTSQPRVEVINDRSRDVATLLRILQRHYQPFIDTLRWRFGSRAEFDRLLAVDPETCTDLERAARFLYLQRLSFGGRVSGRTFGIDPSNPSRFRLSTLEPMLQEVHDRLDRVWIECLPYADFISRWDRPGTLFYLDPPYADSTDDYGKGMFAAEDFARLAALLGTLRGGFILSINDTPAMRATFSGFAVEDVPVTYSVAGGRGSPTRELIISGGPLLTG